MLVRGSFVESWGMSEGWKLFCKLTCESQGLERRDHGRSAFSRRRRKMESWPFEHVSAVGEAPC